MRARIAVLFHERQARKRISWYVVDTYTRIWREQGLDVRWVFGVDRHEPADAVLLHVDLSVVPDEYLAFASGYPVALNLALRDIRKSTYSRLRVLPDSSWDGRVIAKSDLNHGGLPERWLTRGPRLRQTPRYEVYGSVSEVPLRFWGPRYVVEKFMPEVDGGLYHVRSLLCLGERASAVRVSSPDAIVRGGSTNRVEVVPVDGGIMTLRRQLGVDYGKLDYVIHDGEAVLLDVNKTPGTAPGAMPADALAAQRNRAAGIFDYLKGARRWG